MFCNNRVQYYFNMHISEIEKRGAAFCFDMLYSLIENDHEIIVIFLIVEHEEIL